MQTTGTAAYNEQRHSPRKILKVKALLAMEGAEPIVARTQDVGAEGMCLTVDRPCKAGALGTIRFEIFNDGKIRSISVRSRVQYCILSNGDYKAGFQFVNLELSAMASLAKYLQQ